MLAAQLFGTTGVAVLLLLAEAQDLPALRDVALSFVLLAVLATVAFVKRFPSRADGGDGP
jgi:multicomponent Na+:H+ antiporter subunit F